MRINIYAFVCEWMNAYIIAKIIYMPKPNGYKTHNMEGVNHMNVATMLMSKQPHQGISLIHDINEYAAYTALKMVMEGNWGSAENVV